jgi:hypothetical protein
VLARLKKFHFCTTATFATFKKSGVKKNKKVASKTFQPHPPFQLKKACGLKRGY